jgi:hypothetical protein
LKIKQVRKRIKENPGSFYEELKKYFLISISTSIHICPELDKIRCSTAVMDY